MDIKRKNEYGMSLLGAMIAVAITGVLAVTMNELLSRMFGASSSVESNAELRSIIDMLDSKISCEQTRQMWISTSIDPLTCNGLVNVYDKNGNVVISPNSSTPTKVGGWTLRALCRGAGTSTALAERGLEIQAARLKPDADPTLTTTTPAHFQNDPLVKNRILGWGSINTRNRPGYEFGSSLFMKGARLCQNNFYPAGTDPRQPVDCIVNNQNLIRLDNTQNAAGYRVRTITCPNSHPFAMSSHFTPSCQALDGMSRTHMGADYPRSVSCSIRFFPDVWAPGHAEYTWRNTWCTDNGQDPHQGTCGGVCCNFAN